jgi:hypothetical protein
MDERRINDEKWNKQKKQQYNLISYGINKKIKRIEASTISIQKCSKQYDSECH